MAIKLTARQQQILDLIKHQLELTGFPPTRAEIARELGFRSANAAEDHLKALARKGAIALTAGASRGIRLIAGGSGASPVATSVPVSKTTGLASSPPGPESLSRGPSASEVSRGARHASPEPGLFDRLLLPVIGRVAAGSPVLATEHIDREISVEPSMFQNTPDYLLKVRGLSMRDAGILDGDLLAVKKVTEARNGQIVVARLGDDVTVKRLQRDKHGIRLLPENPDFQPIVVSSADDFTLEGIAVGLIRTLQ